MTCIPFDKNEYDEFKARLNVRLPASWETRLSDPKFVKLLSHPSLGAFSPKKTMLDFAELTLAVRASQPEFPRDGVLMFCATGPNGGFEPNKGYSRFWRSRPDDPTRLDEKLYAWDSQQRRQHLDCDTDEWLDSYVEVLSEDHPDAVTALGFELSFTEVAELHHTRPVNEALMQRLNPDHAEDLSQFGSDRPRSVISENILVGSSDARRLIGPFFCSFVTDKHELVG